MKKYNTGFTMVELLIVIAIIGILAGVGYPSYVSHMKKAQCADGIDSLLSLAGRMEEFYMNNDTYVGATVGTTGTVGSDQTSDGLYVLAVPAVTLFAYTLTATPVDSGQKTLTLNSLGQKSEAGGAANAAMCW